MRMTIHMPATNPAHMTVHTPAAITITKGMDTGMTTTMVMIITTGRVISTRTIRTRTPTTRTARAA